jgi:hypothetical protein
VKELSFNIYIPSYKRAKICTTHNFLEYGTYIVRKSEEESYKAADLGNCNVVAVDDSLIGGLIEVNQWVINSTPEDVICVLDDDILHFRHRLDVAEELTDPEIITSELERIAQLMVDMNVGFGCVDSTAVPWNYDGEFAFKGTAGSTRWFNKRAFKAKLDKSVEHNYDLDVVLQELMMNRIIIKPRYFCSQGKPDVVEGGASEKLRKEQIAQIELMKDKWGKYFYYDFKKNKPFIRVNR